MTTEFLHPLSVKKTPEATERLDHPHPLQGLQNPGLGVRYHWFTELRFETIDDGTHAPLIAGHVDPIPFLVLT